MSVGQRVRDQWREREEPSSASDARFRDLFWRPWWHPLNLLMILMPGFWGAILGAVVGIAFYLLILAIPVLLAWELIFH